MVCQGSRGGREELGPQHMLRARRAKTTAVMVKHCGEMHPPKATVLMCLTCSELSPSTSPRFKTTEP